MAVSRRYGRVSVNTNIDAVIQRIQGSNYPQGIYGAVWSDVEYAVYQEFGTSKMAPAFMIRRSIPAIQDFMAAEFRKLRQLPTPLEMQAMVDRVLVFAREEIARNTRVRTGRLRRSWQIQKARMR